MAASNALVQGGSGAWIVPCVLTNGKLDDTFGTASIFQVVGKVGYSFPIGTESTETEYVDIALANGVTMQKDKRTTFVDGAGNAKAGGATGNVDTVTFDLYENDHTTISALKAIGDVPVVVCIPQGDSNADGFVYLLGRFSSAISVEKSGNAANAVAISVQGKAYELDGGSVAATFASALMAKLTAITQYGTGTIINPSANVVTTSAALVAGDIANPGLLAGTLVMKKGT